MKRFETTGRIYRAELSDQDPDFWGDMFERGQQRPITAEAILEIPFLSRPHLAIVTGYSIEVGTGKAHVKFRQVQAIQ